MGAQSQINSLIGQVGGGVVAMKALKNQSKMAEAAENQNKAAAEEEKKKESYANRMYQIFGEEIVNNKSFKDPEMFEKALNEMESRKAMMLVQREAVRTYRNQYAPGSDEYNRIEEAGQKRKEANFADFRKSLRKIRRNAGGNK